ncbi:hypothetical protein Tco_1550503 [Tanacetum coccineum]
MCPLDTTHHHHLAAAAADTMVAEVGTANNTYHTTAEHNQVGYKLPAVEHCKPWPCAQILQHTCPNDMTANRTSSQSPTGVALYYPSSCSNPALMLSEV